MTFQKYEAIETHAITNDTFIISVFARCLMTNGEQADQRITLECAPTTKGEIAYYLTTNGDPVPVALQNENGIHWGNEAFGRGFDTSDWLPDYSEWLAGYAFRNELNGELDSNIIAFADALDRMQEQLAD